MRGKQGRDRNYAFNDIIVWLQQTRIGLSLFDIQGLGFLKESVS